MDAIDYKFWWNVALTLVTGVIAVIVWLRKPGEEAMASLPKMKKEFDDALLKLKDLFSAEVAELRSAQRLIDEKIRNIPGAREVDQLAGDVRVVKTEVEALSKTQDAQTAALARIEQFLLQQGRTR
jgi:hypothetical protein